MQIVIELKDKETLAHIERLRGNLPAPEFAYQCLMAGLRQAAAGSRDNTPSFVVSPGASANTHGRLISLGKTGKKFVSVDADTVIRVLQGNDRKNPIFREGQRLITRYMKILDDYHKSTGHRLPGRINVDSLAPIERICLEVVVKEVRKGERKTEVSAMVH